MKQTNIEKIDDMVSVCHEAAKGMGWWTNLETGEPKEADVPEILCLIHSEVSEALEGYRKNLMDDKLTHRKMFDVELADIIIRTMDLAGAMRIELGTILIEKLNFNRTREDHKPENRRKEGGKKF